MDERTFADLTSANHEPAVATYVRAPGSDGRHGAFGLTDRRWAGRGADGVPRDPVPGTV